MSNCPQCKHTASSHRTKEIMDDSGRVQRVVVRCHAELENGDDCSCLYRWFRTKHKRQENEDGSSD
jgi:hypothetical protein